MFCESRYEKVKRGTRWVYYIGIAPEGLQNLFNSSLCHSVFGRLECRTAAGRVTAVKWFATS